MDADFDTRRFQCRLAAGLHLDDLGADLDDI